VHAPICFPLRSTHVAASAGLAFAAAPGLPLPKKEASAAFFFSVFTTGTSSESAMIIDESCGEQSVHARAGGRGV
jgi:hypothetical protein